MKLCLCGSTRFMDQFHEANVALSLAGHIVYSVATSTKGDFQPTVEQKLMLDMVHLRKIDESDAVVIVGRQPDGTYYIGESTRREIAYAYARGKSVDFFEGAREIYGPANEFRDCLQRAATTDAQRKQAEAEYHASLRAEFGESEDEDGKLAASPTN